MQRTRSTGRAGHGNRGRARLLRASKPMLLNNRTLADPLSLMAHSPLRRTKSRGRLSAGTLKGCVRRAAHVGERCPAPRGETGAPLRAIRDPAGSGGRGKTATEASHGYLPLRQPCGGGRFGVNPEGVLHQIHEPVAVKINAVRRIASAPRAGAGMEEPPCLQSEKRRNGSSLMMQTPSVTNGFPPPSTATPAGSKVSQRAKPPTQ